MPADPAYRARLARTDPAYLARLEEADRLRADFAAAFGVGEARWSDYNLTRLLRATGERPARVAEIREIVCDLSSGRRGQRTWGGPVVPSLGNGGVFDHLDMWGRPRHPTMLIGHPYGIAAEEREALAYLARTFPTLRVSVDDRPSYYGFGTNHVRVELVELHRPFVNPRGTHRTRAAGRAARKAFAEEFTT
jgi:hypothetical protein